MNAPLPETKEGLRRFFRALGASLDKGEAAKADARILEFILSMPEYRASDSVFTYVSVFPEPDTAGFIRCAMEDGKRVAVPYCTEKQGVMLAKLICTPEDLEKDGRYGIPSPKCGLPELLPEDIAFALVPGVCFGPRGQRLGRGGGYYDRFLTCFGGFSVGVCRAAAFGVSVPEFAFDRRVDAVVTEDGVYKFKEKG
jgi:5-formyltetrahydrofolate cyclo-ligase